MLSCALSLFCRVPGDAEGGNEEREGKQGSSLENA